MRDPRPTHRHASVRPGLTSIATSLLLALVACGGSSSGDDDDGPDAGAPDARPVVTECGNGLLEDGEDCDDGNTDPDLVCDGECRFACGNGAIEPGELCDLEGAGDDACPADAAACDDSDACTQDTLTGSECQSACVHAPITTNTDGDGCCVEGATSLDDSDCAVACGNFAVEAGELCDTAIAAGSPGACPASCSDGLTCTTDALVDAGTCTARCEYPDITEPVDADGCCPSGESSLTDDDCPVGCNNGVHEPPGETCDTAIPAGMAGACPTACPTDSNACTTDTLANAGTCTAACVYVPITAPSPSADGCCPAGGNANNDADCAPVCGNSVVETGEDCDDGNSIPDDSCDACAAVIQPTAFRFTDLDLRDPHVYVSVITCNDATDVPVFGIFAVNTELSDAITLDGDDPPDGNLDLNIALVFRPLDQASSATTPLEVHFGECTSASPTTCTADPAPVMSTATNMATGCLGAIAGTLTPMYTPEIAAQNGPCFVSDAETLTIDLSGIPVVLTDARVAGQYSGSPAGTVVNGLVRGFISEAAADATLLPADLPVVGGQPLSQQLPGGNPPGSGNTNCAGHSDKDTNGGVPGWWFYLNFTAVAVNWSE